MSENSSIHDSYIGAKMSYAYITYLRNAIAKIAEKGVLPPHSRQ
jgi:hypothetical protein